eukprot:s4444_g5.t1
MSLLAEFEASMKAKWNDMLQKVQSLESDLGAARTTQAGMREDYEGLMDKSAWEQKQYLAVMLASHAAATDAVTRKQASSSEQIAQFKQSLDKAQAEADLVKTQHEQTLEQTRWVVSKVAELEGLVSRFRERDQTIQRELERSDAKVEAPRQKLQPSPSGLGDIPSGPSYYNLTPEIPGDERMPKSKMRRHGGARASSGQMGDKTRNCELLQALAHKRHHQRCLQN